MKSNVDEEKFNQLMDTIFVEYGVNHFIFEHYNNHIYHSPNIKLIFPT